MSQRVTDPLSADPAIEAEWLSRLIEAGTPQEVGAVIVEMARSLPACEAASLLWGGDAEEHIAGVAVASDGLSWARLALVDEPLQLSADGRRAAWRLLPRERAVLLLQFASRQTARPLREMLESHLALASQRLSQALKLVDLHDSHKQLERSENLQSALFAISDLAGSDLDMPEMLRGIHTIVSTLMYGENFFIVRYDAERQAMRFLYYADVEDELGQDTTRETPLESWRGTLTWYLLTSGRALMGSAEQLLAQVDGPLRRVGPDSTDWLGVPMLRNGQVRGALVVQSYREGSVYTRADRVLLKFVGSHILTALERKQSKDELEQRVRQRTQELAEANRGL